LMKHAKTDTGEQIVFRGDNRMAMVAACIFYACRRKSHVCTIKQLSQWFNITTTVAVHGCKSFINIMKKSRICFDYGSNSPHHYIDMICDDFNIDDEYRNRMHMLCRNARRLNICTTHMPATLAVACAYLLNTINNMELYDNAEILEHYEYTDASIIKAYNILLRYSDIITNTKKMNNIICENMICDDDMPESLRQQMTKFGVDTNMMADIYMSHLLKTQNYDEYILYVDKRLSTRLARTEKQHDLIMRDIHI